jgi:type IV pilus assembly protein PilN
LKDEIQALLARKQIIETLQADRAQTVHLLDQMVRQMPEGVYLKSIVQKGMRINLAGYAQSNARVSTLMRNIESSPWLENPVLVEVKAANVDKRRVSEFTMFVTLKRAALKEEKPAATPAPAAKKG